MKSLALLILCFGLGIPLLFAGEVYKCKGAHGETVYTNIQCKNAAESRHIGSYEAVPDDPRQLRDAEAQQAERDFDQQNQQQFAAQQAIMQRRAAETEEINQANAEREKRFNELTDEARTEALRGHKRAAEQLSGLAAMYSSHGSAAASASGEQSGTYPPAASFHAPVAAPPPPQSESSYCQGGQAGSVTCYDERGVASFGKRDAFGNADVSGPDGQTQYIYKDEITPTQPPCVQGSSDVCK